MGFDFTALASHNFELPDKWRIVKVGDMVNINELSIQENYEHDRIEYIDIASVEKGVLRETQRILLKEAPSRARRIVRDNDMLISTVRPNLEHYVFIKKSKPNLVASTGFAVVSAKKADPRFIYYYLMTKPFTEYLTRIADAHTSAYPSFNPDVIEKAELLLPPDGEQRAIAHILGSLDDKIELNRQMNETLEAMARAIFKSWFVDFDPVRAKAEGRDPGLPKEIADLFPNSFENSSLGEIPKGWEVKALPEVIDINPPRSLRKGEEAPYVDMKNMPTHGHRPSACILRPFGSGTKFVNGDTLLARITPCLENGKTAFVDFLSEGQVGWGSTEYIVLRPKLPLPDYYGYLLARDERLRNFAIGNMTGSSGRQRVPADCFSNFFIVNPPKDVAEIFGKMVSTLQATIKTTDEESRTLAAIRDALLPKLISGELRVPDAGRIAVEVV